LPESLSNTHLKNRLLGAGILVFAAVIVIPLFLGDPKHGAEQESMPVKSTEFESRIQPLPNSDSAQQNASNAIDAEDKGLVLKKLSGPPVSTSDLPKQVDIQPLRLDEEIARADPVAKVAKTTAKTTTTTTAPTPRPAAKKSVAKNASTPKASAPKASAGDLKAGWVVQAGIFSKPENAVAIAGILKNNGYAPNVSNAKASFGNAKRVWIGPFVSKSEAQAISRRLEQQTGNGGYVAAYPFKS
jgi:DedD protein